MQSKISFFNMALFKKNFSRTWIPGLIYFVILLLLLPVSFLISTANSGDDWYSQMGYTMEMRLYEHMSAIPTTMLTATISIVVAGITFWYLFSKRDNYMMHAFPVSRRSLYFTGLISSLVVCLIPVIVTSVIMTIVALAQGATSVLCVWYWALIMVVTTFLFIAIALFSLMTTGQIVTGILFYWLFNVLYFLMEFAFRVTASLLMFGMGNAVTGIKQRIWTPLLFLPEKTKVYSYIQTDDMGEKVISFIHEFKGGQYLAIYSVAAVVIIIIAYQMYRFKKLETVQDFIAAPFIKPIFSVGMSFFISMVAGACVAGMAEAVKTQTYNAKFAIAICSAIIIGIIIYFATKMMIEKTLRVFSMKTFVQCGIYTVAALVVLLCLRFDAFNVENKVPKAKDIEWAAIYDQYPMVFYDKDEIAALCDLHKNFIDDKKELRDVNILYSDVPGTTYSIKYKLKNGEMIVREYSVVDTQSNEVSAKYVSATQPILDFINDPLRIKEHVIGNTWNTGVITAMDFSTYTYDDTVNEFIYNSNTFDALSNTEKRQKFGRVYESLLKDIDEGKVFVQSFASSESYGDNNLYNDFSFTIADKYNEYFSDSDHYWSSEYDTDEYNYRMFEQSIYVSMTRDCINTLEALKDEGFYDNEDQIVTYEEYNKKMGYDNYDGLDGGVEDY